LSPKTLTVFFILHKLFNTAKGREIQACLNLQKFVALCF